MPHSLTIRRLGRRPYLSVWRAMQAFTGARDSHTRDELWLVEHDPVFTLGLGGREEHVVAPGDIPVLRCDRGGQVTYHGPGQLVAYILLDLRRRGLGVKRLVHDTEAALIRLLANYGIQAGRRPGAPGVYVEGAKIAALGYRVRRGCCYHGVSLNVAMDLEPFGRIHPCGYTDLSVTQLTALGGPGDLARVGDDLARELAYGWESITMEASEPDIPALQDPPDET